MKFLIVNAFHRDDKGDAALVHVLIDQLLSIDPSADIVLSSMEKPDEYSTFYKGRNIGSFELQSSSHVHPGPLHLFFKAYIFLTICTIGASKGRCTWLLSKDLKKIYNECVSADLVISVGGGYFITKHDLGSRIHLLFALQILRLCKQIGRKVVTAPVSVGPFRNVLEAKYTVHMLRNLDLILLRENISKKFFVDKNDILPPNVERAVDSGFAFMPTGSFDIRKIAAAGKDDLVLLLAVRNWTKKAGGNFYDQAHADLIDHIAEKYPKIKPVFIPQCTFPDDVEDDDDRNVARRIIALSKTKKAVVIEEDVNYCNVKLSYKDADFIVGTRFHSMVFGLSYNVPGIAIEYEHKTRGIMRELGLEEWVIPIGTISSENLLALFDRMMKEKDLYRKHLVETMPEYIRSANEVIKIFSDVLKK